MYICKIMSSNFGYIDIILLAMIAGFIILRLRNILGRKTGHESKVFTDFSEKRYESFRKQKVNYSQNIFLETLNYSITFSSSWVNSNLASNSLNLL